MKHTTTIDQQEIAKFSQIASQWWDTDGPLKTLHDINPARLAFIEQTVLLNGLRVLDVGCGGGILSEAMAKQGAAVTGLDAEVDSIKAAQQHANQNALNIEYVHSAIETFNAPAFDVVVCMEMLEHVNEPQVVINHCVRLLKPGGYLFLSTINRSIKAYLQAVVAAEYLLRLLPRQTHDYNKFIKPSELSAMIRATEMDVMSIKGLSYNPFNRQATIQSDVSVNYLLSAHKPLK